MMIETVVVSSSLLIATLFDVKTKKIPNYFNFFYYY